MSDSQCNAPTLLTAAAGLAALLYLPSVMAETLRCDGSGHTPVLYENQDFSGIVLRMPLQRTTGIYVSDEESFNKRASAVCVQAGYRVVLYDQPAQQGASLELTGPIQKNLHQTGWGDRTSSVLVSKVAAPITAAPPAAPARVDGHGTAGGGSGVAVATPAPPPQPAAEPSDFDVLKVAYAEATGAADCETVLESYEAIVSLEESMDRPSSEPVMIRGRLRPAPPTVGALATIWRRELVFDHQVRCFAPAALQIERQARIAMLPNASCQAVRDAIGDLSGMTQNSTHVPDPWANQVGSRDATAGELAGFYVDQIREQRISCLGADGG